MLAARDQENLVHGHRAAAASKPLNQGAKYLQPKTPGNKVPKTPFRVPLNDENGPPRFGGGKSGLNGNVKGAENLMTGGRKGGLGDKKQFITPLDARGRAPLGLKTTNAKTKVFQTPAPLPVDNEAKKERKSVSARKAKTKVNHAEMTKIEGLGDEDKLEDREIEYMPPRAKDKPDYPDDIPHDLDLSMFENGGFTQGFMYHFATRVGDDGLSFYERQERQRLRENEIADKKTDARLLRDFESTNIPCIHEPECIEIECLASIESKRAAEEKYQKTIAALSTPHKSPKKKPVSKGPSTVTSKSAAVALSLPKPTTGITAPNPPPKTSRPFPKTSSLLSRPKATPPPTNPSTMRHTASTATSKTTIGHSKGRIASAALKKKPAPALTKDVVAARPAETRDTTLAPALYIQRYGIPRLGSEMWFRCQGAGCFDESVQQQQEEYVADQGNELDDFLREEAERDFVL